MVRQKRAKTIALWRGWWSLLQGAVAATIAVPLLRGDLDWREETFSVHLEQSTHARIAKAVAVATIREEGSVARNVLAAYAARFVRTSSVQVVEALRERIRSGTDASVCGAGDRADLVRIFGSGCPTGGHRWASCLGGVMFRRARRCLAGGLACGAAGRSGGSGVGERGDSICAGRYQRDCLGWIIGGMNAGWRVWSWRTVGATGSFALNQDTGVLSSGLTGMYPYVAYQHQTGGIWVSGGYGRGRAEGLDLSGRLTSGFGALGVRGTLVSMQALRLSYHGDAWYADAVVSDLDVTAQVYQTRLGMEAQLDLGESSSSVCGGECASGRWECRDGTGDGVGGRGPGVGTGVAS